MKEVNAALITIGDELLIGQTIDTNSAFIAQKLNTIGIWVKRRIAIGDVKKDILDAIHEVSKDCEIIILTGGLGPTADDVTKPVLCEYFKTTLVINENALQNVKTIFSKLNRHILDVNLQQAEVPQNCEVLQNKRGTAPGMWFQTDQNKIIVSLPGVPHEMKGLMTEEVIPRLESTFELPALVHKTLLTAGIGESFLAQKINHFETALPNHIKLAYLPAYGMVRLRLTGRGEDAVRLQTEINENFHELKQIVSEWLVADEDITLQEALVNLLRKEGVTLGTAESCTGGYMAHLITSISGSSRVFKGSVVSYANDIKESVLGVKKETLDKYGAVSEETVKQMLVGALQQLKTDYGIATSGIMGPDGGSEAKPVGTVWIAVGNKDVQQTKKMHFRFDRGRNIELSAMSALYMMFTFIKNK